MMGSRLLFFLMLITLSGLVGLLSACEESHSTTGPYYHRVAAQTLQLQPSYEVQRRFVGRVEAKQRVDLGFELAGTLAEVNIDGGDQVATGQVLVSLDTRLLEDERKQLQATQDELIARRKLTDLEISRQEKLQHQGFAAEQRMDELKTEAVALLAQYRRQGALLAALATKIEKSTLRADYAADIANLYLDKGAVVSPGQPVLQILEQGNLEASVGVPSSLTKQLMTGQEVQVSHGSQEVSARLISIGRVIDTQTRTVKLKLALSEAMEVVEGDAVFLLLDEKREQSGFWLPVTALNDGVRGMWNVLMMIPQAEPDRFILEPRSIEILHRSDGQVFVRGALEDGEQVVAAGLHRIAPGLRVRTMAAEG